MKRDELLHIYYSLGFSHEEILVCLAVNNGIIISARHLRRLLSRQGLDRQKGQSDILSVALFVEDEVQRSGQLYGYRWMHLRCLQQRLCGNSKHGPRTATTSGSRRCGGTTETSTIVRRMYSSAGPNAAWHMDGYDELKPFGIAINGCIDGYSRKIMWLEAYTRPITTPRWYLVTTSKQCGSREDVLLK